jgi:hypothetical protein
MAKEKELAPNQQTCIARYTEGKKSKRRLELAVGANGLVFMRRRRMSSEGGTCWTQWAYDHEVVVDVEDLPLVITKNTWIGDHRNAPVDVVLTKGSIIDSTIHKYALPSTKGAAKAVSARRNGRVLVEGLTNENPLQELEDVEAVSEIEDEATIERAA